MRSNCGAFSSAPRIGFCPTRISAREMTRSFSARSSDLGTAFHSPAATALFRRPPQRDWRSWPTPSIPTPNLSSNPFGLELLSSPAFGGWGGSTLATRCLIPDPQLSNIHRFPLPFGAFPPLRLKALYRWRSLRKLTLANSPIFLRSPTAPIITNRTCRRIIVPDPLPSAWLTAL